MPCVLDHRAAQPPRGSRKLPCSARTKPSSSPASADSLLSSDPDPPCVLFRPIRFDPVRFFPGNGWAERLLREQKSQLCPTQAHAARCLRLYVGSLARSALLRLVDHLLLSSSCRVNLVLVFATPWIDRFASPTIVGSRETSV